MLRTYIPQEILQRNIALGCPAFVTRCQIFDASHIFNPVTQCSINSFINLQCRNLFSNVYGCLSNTNYPTAPITSEGPISFVNVQNLILIDYAVNLAVCYLTTLYYNCLTNKLPHDISLYVMNTYKHFYLVYRMVFCKMHHQNCPYR